MFVGTTVIGIALIILGLGMMGVFGASDTPLKVAGWLALFFGIFSWYGATAILMNTVYKKQILPF
jgi:succinate-acetate transporter protein